MNLEGTLKSQATAVVQDSNWILILERILISVNNKGST